MPEDRTSTYEIALTHFIVSSDVERSCRFYTDVLGGRVIRSGEPSYVALANSWIIINVGGGPTDDKPSVVLETPPDPDRASSFLNIRVSDIQSVHAEWSARGAEFLTPPKQHQSRDPLLHARPRWLPDRSRPDHPAGRLGPVPASSPDRVPSVRARDPKAGSDGSEDEVGDAAESIGY